MQVTHWQKNLHGKFFNGDSYIILNTYKEPGSDVSFSMAYPRSSLCMDACIYTYVIRIMATFLLIQPTQELKYDLHFWIGQYSSQDEYGTAAYKTVELDTLVRNSYLHCHQC